MKAHISVANMLVLATTSHGKALREGIEEKKHTSNIDGVRMDSSAKVIKSSPVSSRNLLNEYYSQLGHGYQQRFNGVTDYGEAYSSDHGHQDGEDDLIPRSQDDDSRYHLPLSNYDTWQMADSYSNQVQPHQGLYLSHPSDQQSYSQHSSAHQSNLLHPGHSSYGMPAPGMPAPGIPAPGYTAPLPRPPHTSQRAPPMLPHNPHQPERDSSSSAVDADSDASDSSDESGNDSDHNSGSHWDEIENHSDLASGSRSGEIDDHRSIMARPNHEEPENDSDDAAESDSDPSKRDKKPSRFKMIQNVVTKAGGKAKKGLKTKLSSFKRLSFKKSE